MTLITFHWLRMFSRGRTIEKCVKVRDYGIVWGNLLDNAGKRCVTQQTSEKVLSMLKYEPRLETHFWW
jgi:phage baseplate assembly protein W